MDCPRCHGRNGYRLITVTPVPSSLERINNHTTPFVSAYSCIYCGHHEDVVPEPMQLAPEDREPRTSCKSTVKTQRVAIQYFDQILELNKTMGFQKIAAIINAQTGKDIFYQTLHRWHTEERRRRGIPVNAGRSPRSRREAA